MFRSTATFATEHGSRYLQQLFKHFAHKIEVTFDAHRGEARLSPGPCRLRADATGLHIEVEAEDYRALIEARYIVDKHLVTFAFRDGFCGFDWRAPEALAAPQD